MSIEFDHIFCFINRTALDELTAKLAGLGLVETYRRRHVGQGTANICYCFDNAFLELLWVEDDSDVATSAIERTQFAKRGYWFSDASAAINPFGIAWRGTNDPLGIEQCWDFSPPYLPKGKTIAVANSSDDLANPFLFSFPGTLPPKDMAPERRGALQHDAGFNTLSLRHVTAGESGCRDLSTLGFAGVVSKGPHEARLEMVGTDRRLSLCLPDFELG